MSRVVAVEPVAALEALAVVVAAETGVHRSRATRQRGIRPRGSTSTAASSCSPGRVRATRDARRSRSPGSHARRLAIADVKAVMREACRRVDESRAPRAWERDMTFAATDEAVHVRAPGKINVFMWSVRSTPTGTTTSRPPTRPCRCTRTCALARRRVLHRVLAADRLVAAADGCLEPAIRAAKLLARHAGVPGGVRLEIDKHVRSRAAWAAGRRMPRRPSWRATRSGAPRHSKEELHALAASLGADVPFASGRHRDRHGRGDRLAPRCDGSFHWVLAVAEFGLPRRRVPRARPAALVELLARPLAAALAVPTVDSAVLQAFARRRRAPPRCAATISSRRRWSLAPGLAGILQLGEDNGAIAASSPGRGRPPSRSSSTTPTR